MALNPYMKTGSVFTFKKGTVLYKYVTYHNGCFSVEHKLVPTEETLTEDYIHEQTRADANIGYCFYEPSENGNTADRRYLNMKDRNIYITQTVKNKPTNAKIIIAVILLYISAIIFFACKYKKQRSKIIIGGCLPPVLTLGTLFILQIKKHKNESIAKHPEDVEEYVEEDVEECAKKNNQKKKEYIALMEENIKKLNLPQLYI